MNASAAEVGAIYRSHDGTRRLLVTLADGAYVETVVLPRGTRTSVCISSQVGCARGCIFCVTASLGLRRSLAAAELVAQVHLARSVCEREALPTVRNVLYMGMGEPLDNLDAVAQSVAELTNPKGLAFAPRHVTISTVGTSPRAIEAVAKLGVNLAWSLHSANQECRASLIPTARHALHDLRHAFVSAATTKNKLIFVELALIKGVNDSRASAEDMAAFLAPFGNNIRINLMSLNPGRERLLPTDAQTLTAYRQILRAAGFFCSVRAARGADIRRGVWSIVMRSGLQGCVKTVLRNAR